MTGDPVIAEPLHPRLFMLGWDPREVQLPDDVARLADEKRRRAAVGDDDSAEVNPEPGPDLLEVFDRAIDPLDVNELTKLFLGRVEARLDRGPTPSRAPLAERWLSSRPKRSMTVDEIMSSPATVGLVKSLFNAYFRDDLYGEFRRDETVILSSGAVDEELFGLPGPLRDSIGYAVERDWYGYSDSRGRDATREALARYESARMRDHDYERHNISIGLGGTALMAGIADMVMSRSPARAPAVCGIPNYPPLVQAVSRRGPVTLAPISERRGIANLSDLIATVGSKTPLVLLQTALNPTGALVTDSEIARLLDAVGPSTIVVLDECHEWLGDVEQFSKVRADSRVVRVNSLSKNWSAPGLKVGWLIASREFVDEFYEYSSTCYGGPASIFYTLVEFTSRMERWRLEGIERPGPAELDELEQSYRLNLRSLGDAYARYVTQRVKREVDLGLLRDASFELLQANGASLLDPTCSINLAVAIGEGRDGYAFFRDLLAAEGVSVFPGILTLVLSQDLVRVTVARSWEDLSSGLPALARMSSDRLVQALLQSSGASPSRGRPRSR